MASKHSAQFLLRTLLKMIFIVPNKVCPIRFQASEIVSDANSTNQIQAFATTVKHSDMNIFPFLIQKWP